MMNKWEGGVVFLVALGLVVFVFYLTAKWRGWIGGGSAGSGSANGQTMEMMKAEDQETVATNLQGASDAYSKSMANLRATADMSDTPVKLESGGANLDSSKASLVLEDLKFATKGDGRLRPTFVDGRPVDTELRTLAMFENQDFMPRETYEFPVKEMPHLYDPTQKKQKSPFRPMTYPLVYDHRGNALGMDVIRDQRDVRTNVSAQGRLPLDLAHLVPGK